MIFGSESSPPKNRMARAPTAAARLGYLLLAWLFIKLSLAAIHAAIPLPVAAAYGSGVGELEPGRVAHRGMMRPQLPAHY